MENVKQQFLQSHFLQQNHKVFLKYVEVRLIDKTKGSDPAKREFYWMRTLCHDFVLLSCHVPVWEWIHALYLPKYQGTPCLKQAEIWMVKSEIWWNLMVWILRAAIRKFFFFKYYSTFLVTVQFSWEPGGAGELICLIFRKFIQMHKSCY